MPLTANLNIAAGAVICHDALLIGEITVRCGTIIHPKAQIIAETGPIIIGENNLIEENACITNRSPDSRSLLIGNCNVFEIGSETFAKSIGNNNVVEVKAFVGDEVELSDGCVVGAGCRLSSAGRLSERSVIYGGQNSRRIAHEKPMIQNSQLEYLRKALPNYHHLLANKNR